MGEKTREQRGKKRYSEERMIDKEEPSGDNGKRATGRAVAAPSGDGQRYR